MKNLRIMFGLLIVLTMLAGLSACGATPTEEVAVEPTKAPPTDAPAEPEPTEPPPTEAPTEVPPTEVPPTEVPPTDVPPTEVPPTEAPPEPTELRVGLSLDVESMDPFFVNQAAGWSVVHALFDHLVDRDFDGNIVPGLATSWTSTEDPPTIEFELREGVTFHNGEPFNAESVKFSVERMLAEEEAPNQGKFTSIDSVEVVDDYTVRFNLNKPDGTLFDSLTSRLAMLPPLYFEEVGAEGFAEAPVGTGPFTFVEWLPDDHVTLVANEDYWEGSYKGMPAVDTVVFRPIPEAATRAAELEAGGVDLIQDVLPDQMDELETAGLVVVPDEAFQLQYVFVTTDDEADPTYDVALSLRP
jgi:ABC-type transport system substrate-binding protein